MSIREQLATLFHEVLEVPEDQPVEHLTYRGIASWDSVGHMRLVAALETKFGVLLTTDQILELSSFNQGLDILKSHGVAD